MYNTGMMRRMKKISDNEEPDKFDTQISFSNLYRSYSFMWAINCLKIKRQKILF
jgi:hypothetical protein